MKTKLLIVLLIVAIIGLGTLLGMKLFMKENETDLGSRNQEEDNSAISNEPEKPKSRYDGNKRTLAVVIDNVDAAKPQTSLNEAMTVYEATVEGGLTRFLAIYKDPKVEDIGPVRSARPYFIDYALENDSIFVHFGGSAKALSEIETLKIDSINGLYSPGNVYWRTNQKKAPHNAIAKVAEIWKYAESKNIRTTTTQRNVLNYVTDEVELEDATVANTVNVPYTTSKVKFVYNAETKRYDRYVGNTLQKDWTTGEALTTKNIIITFAHNYSTDEDGRTDYRQAIENIGSLNGYYITNGKAIKIKCKKTTRSGRTVYEDLEGNEIKVNDGNTYIQIVPLNTSVTFS